MRRLLAIFIAFLAAIVAAPSMASAAVPNSITDLLPKARYPAFYIPPSPLPAGKPGDVIRYRRISFQSSISGMVQGTIGYAVMYLSTSATGQPIAVTGTILVPTNHTPPEGADNRPLVGYGNEAVGLGDNCAPSRILQFGNSGEIPLFSEILKRGYVIAASDYEGLGTPAVHTFGVTVSAAHTMLDILRAARNIQEIGLKPDGKVGVFGYSQGGAAAAGAAELAPYYAPDVKLTAAAAGGAPIDPIAFSKNNSGKIFSSVNFAAAAGYDAAYPELDLKSFLNEKGRIANGDSYNACIESIATLAFKKSSDYLTRDIYTDPKWDARFEQNHLGHIAPQIPTLYFHAVYDQAAPYRSATQLRRAWCEGGTPLRFEGLYGFEHVTAGPQWMPVAARWLADQFNGKVDKGNCGYFPKKPIPAPPADGGV
jgi:pimeloyl-ACP methyl ester carboxylesterase